MNRALAFGAAALAISAGAASAQAVFPSQDGYTATAPLYDYASPASGTSYGPLIYTPQLYAPTPAFPAAPAEPGYYTANSVVVPQPLYEYEPGFWAH